MKTPLIQDIEAAILDGDTGKLDLPRVRRLMQLAAYRLDFLEGLPKPPSQPIDRLKFTINYAETTPESAENGENSDSGPLFEEYDCDDFDAVIRMVEQYGSGGWSSWPHCKGTGDWLMSHWEMEDYSTATERQTTIHAVNNRSLKYLEKAWSVVCAK